MEPTSPQILRFDPPYPVFKIAVGEETEVVVTEPLMELTSRQRIAIPNPWNEEEERYLPGIAYGNDGGFVMDVGESFGSLGFSEEHGWFCSALIPKTDVMGGVVQELLAKATAKQTYTQKLLKRTGKKK